MPSFPPGSNDERGAGDDDRTIVRRIPLAMTVALEVVAALRARRRDGPPSTTKNEDAATATSRSEADDASTG